jgi:hypothetical protein
MILFAAMLEPGCPYWFIPELPVNRPVPPLLGSSSMRRAGPAPLLTFRGRAFFYPASSGFDFTRHPYCWV